MLKKEEAAKKITARELGGKQGNVTSQELKRKCFQKEGGVNWSDAIEDSRGWKCQRVCMRLRKLEVTGSLSKAISMVNWGSM